MPLVDEDRAGRAGSAIQILVRAPRGEVDVPIVQRQLDVACGMGQVPADEGSRGMTCRCQAFDVVRLAGREIDTGEEHHGEIVGVLHDGRLEIGGADDGLTRARTDDDEVRLGIQPAGRKVCRQGVSVGREEWAVGEDPSASAGRTKERHEQEVDIDGQAVEQRHLDRSRTDDPAIASRSDPSSVNHGRSGSNQASTPSRAQASSSVATAAAAALGWSPSDRPPDRSREIRRQRRGCGSGRASPAPAAQPCHASARHPLTRAGLR
jgi:hypothetical protein